ncbi:hypothetical protein UUU_30610 [Klebsiella pneumoniae subsp. pneumoniae DSM 30104 = JCM 1662 = NBRC 14940]|nr:hypothetical protein UUU_30610 [Klebsiella pneumoniae subsp. pneumoniae DSM 30104 = JCM 1662 = NBRC 14940]
MNIQHRIHQRSVKDPRHILCRPAADPGNTAPLLRLQANNGHRFTLFTQKT